MAGAVRRQLPNLTLVILVLAPGARAQHGNAAATVPGFLMGGVAYGQEVSVGLGMGIVHPDRFETLWLMGSVRFETSASVAVEPEIGFWKKTEEGLSRRDLSAGVNLYYFLPGGRVPVYVGAGAGSHIFKGALSGTGGGAVSELGVHLIVGSQGRVLNDAMLFANLRYDIVNDAPNQLKAYGGVRLGL